jgi:hypothetical protein
MGAEELDKSLQDRYEMKNIWRLVCFDFWLVEILKHLVRASIHPSLAA